ncbi:transposon ty3-i Gag-Pol polyprotein [Plakobranchus ocellatus]|uniref:Transposon ty3-i Gag-Pol polyprotein n=1 Tax=Plakobranchus ocellatus TaxID=259542 RepID=A0AAV4ASS9_9GAST|nr:transposon ty3-i Gag-Pol polyprotein [Plakobranchus ocellatus]
MCDEISSNRFQPVGNVARLIGLFVVSFPAVPYGLLYYIHLEREKTIAHKNNGNKWEKPMSLSLKAREEVEWWNSTIATAVSPIRRASSKDQSRGGHRRGGCALLAGTTIFSCLDETIGGPTNPALGKKTPSTPSQSSRHLPPPSQETQTPCMQGVGDRLRQQGFSAKATEVMLDSCRPDTKKVYASYITKWQRYAAAIKVDSVSPPITATVNFLADLYEKGASRSALCIARSALSSYVDIQDLGKYNCVR